MPTAILTSYKKVLLSGLTATGKTTHGQLLAEDLGWSYVDMASVRKWILGNHLDMAERDREWTPTHDTLRAADPDIDMRADRLMASVINEHTNVVVDAWLQPWIYGEDDALRVWIESSEEARVMKGVVAALRRGEVAAPDFRNVLAAKDNFSRKHFRQLYSIELFADPAVFDIIIDNSEYINEPSIVDSDAGIAAFRQVLLERATGAIRHIWGADGI